MVKTTKNYIDPKAEVSPDAEIDNGTKIWPFAQIRERARIGKDCNISNGVYIDKDVKIGNRVNIHNKTSIYRPAMIEDDVFIGPHVCFTNDKTPRSNDIKNLKDTYLLVKKGASIGGNSTVLPNVIIGRYAMIGASSLIAKNVPDHGLVFGSPGKLKGFVCICGEKLEKITERNDSIIMECKLCHEKIKIPKKDYEKMEP
jgi:UDP-3-O-[3-hydroxymyristoyl] glucosamine N-acyltransferase